MITFNRLPLKFLHVQYFIRIFMMMSSEESSKLFVFTWLQDFELAEMLHGKKESALELKVGQAVNGKYDIWICAFIST